MAATPKDHYVPQCYLDFFAIEGQGKKEPHIYQYMKDKIVSPRIKDVASEKHYYTFKHKDTGEPIRDIDDYFTELEGRASISLKKVISQNSLNIEAEDYYNLSEFFAILIIRTPGYMKSQKSFRAEAMKELHALEALDKDRLRKSYKDIGIELTEKELVEQQEFILNKEYDVDFGKNSDGFFMKEGMEMAVEFATRFYKEKHWHLLVSNNSSVFITSDNPVSIFKPIFISHHTAGYGNGTILIPISPKHALVFRDLPFKNEVIYVNEQKISEINKNTMRFADNYIYSNLNSNRLHRAYQSYTNNQFQKSKVTRLSWAPYIFMGPPPVPPEILF